MAKLLTLEDITPVRKFTIVVLTGDTPHAILVDAHYIQVLEGHLELFQIIKNQTWVIAVFAPGHWRSVDCEVPTAETFATLAALQEQAQSEAAADAALQQVIRLSAEEAFPQLKH